MLTVTQTLSEYILHVIGTLYGVRSRGNVLPVVCVLIQDLPFQFPLPSTNPNYLEVKREIEEQLFLSPNSIPMTAYYDGEISSFTLYCHLYSKIPSMWDMSFHGSEYRECRLLECGAV
jgi:hypothetical protein